MKECTFVPPQRVCPKKWSITLSPNLSPVSCCLVLHLSSILPLELRAINGVEQRSTEEPNAPATFVGQAFSQLKNDLLHGAGRVLELPLRAQQYTIHKLSSKGKPEEAESFRVNRWTEYDRLSS